MVEIITGIILLIAGIFEIYAVYKTIMRLKNSENAGASPFMPLALLSAAIFGIAIIAFGLAFILKLI
ncbi:hypothetical protein [Pediococcus stilesii]|uniref:hypothetical protein n=1 Tax=Pediococcus stilesii TaxID=331679 RepID=UPI00070B257A|nr:hypothetical protein [Pediococcus stilesii]